MIVKNIYKSILAVLITTLLITTPAAATPPSASVDQTVIMPIPEVVGFSISTATIYFNITGLGITSTTPTYSIRNLGNVNIDLSIIANNDFKSGNNTISISEGDYNIISTNITTPIEKGIAHTFKTGLNSRKGSETTISLYQIFNIPFGTPNGIYNTTLTYTAIKTPTT